MTGVQTCALPIYVEPGDYPVRVTIADVSKEHNGSHEREAYLSLVLRDVEAADIEEARPVSGTGFITVDAGLVAFVDHEAVATAMPEDQTTWYDDVIETGEPDCWFSLLYSSEHYREGAANIVMPLAQAGENVVMSGAG